jgi:hypothetical protein
VFQPHDAHIPYHLQFMCDYNLVGMGIIAGTRFPFVPIIFAPHTCSLLFPPIASRAMFRAPLPLQQPQRDLAGSASSSGAAAVVWDCSSVPTAARAPTSTPR